MVFSLERVTVSASARCIPATAYNPITLADLPTPFGMGDRLMHGDRVHVLERDFRTSTTTFLRSLDGGRTWVAFRAHEILQTVT